MINYTRHLLLVALAGWMNRQQQEVIEYLKEENRVLVLTFTLTDFPDTHPGPNIEPDVPAIGIRLS